ncbi:hypothetical protein [Streptomyces actuosus]|uniref:hypothetical protein n=1 Tax=Streptomyces actuosus TaxID=1885 RepID=UPI0027DA49B4|nr:hypothetical protein [Streptomyces actuosus]
MRLPFGGPGASRPVSACLAVAGIVAGVLVGRTGLDTVVGCGAAGDYYPSQTAEDWITYADHVLVATATREQDIHRRDFTKGPIRYQTDRAVTFRVDDVLWSARKPRHPMGRSFDMTAPGRQVSRGTGERIKRTATDAPRLESGHTYVLALRWTGEEWIVLGEGAAVPFDDRTGDQGEWCGRVLSKEDVASGERFSRSDDHSLEKALLGRNEQAVTRELDRAGRS